MTTRILFFGPVKDAACGAEKLITLPNSVSTIDQLISFIAAGDDHLAEVLRGEHVRVAVDQEIVARDTPLGSPREIAFMAPFSGG